MDFRSLTANTRVEHYPIPHIDKLLLYRLSGCSVFSSLYLETGRYKTNIEPVH